MTGRILLAAALFSSCSIGLAGLGVWQLERAAQKRARHAAFSASQAAAPLDFAALPRAVGVRDFDWRRVHARGHFLDRHVLLDNRLRHGQAGYEVLTPFAVEDGRVVLVARGWVPVGGARERVPDVLAPADTLTVHGHLGPVPISGIALGADADAAEVLSPEIVRVQRVVLEALGPLFDLSLWPAVLYLAPDAPGALAVEWTPPGDGSARHTAYAVQWFAMAGVLAGIGVWSWRRRRGEHG